MDAWIMYIDPSIYSFILYLIHMRLLVQEAFSTDNGLEFC